MVPGQNKPFYDETWMDGAILLSDILKIQANANLTQNYFQSMELSSCLYIPKRYVPQRYFLILNTLEIYNFIFLIFTFIYADT